MRIGIDARFLTHPQAGGFKTYTEQLIRALVEVDPLNEYILYVDRLPDRATTLPTASNTIIKVVPGTAPLIGMPWREQVGLSIHARRDRVDIFHSLCLTAPLSISCPLVVTIHDVIWMNSHPRHHSRSSGKRTLMDRYYRLVPRFAAQRAAAVITVSFDARNAVLRALNISEERVFVTYEAAASVYGLIDRETARDTVQRRFGLKKNFILALGSTDPRKNIRNLLHAYALLPDEQRSTYELVIVWTSPLLAESIATEAHTLGVNDRLRFLYRVSNEDLVALYNAASLFVFPSRHEGFGLPLLEAMACGAPVVAANNSSIPEVVGDAALLVNAEDPRDIAQKMSRVLEDRNLAHSLSQAGIRRSATFSWKRCARETIEIYQVAATGHTAGGNKIAAANCRTRSR